MVTLLRNPGYCMDRKHGAHTAETQGRGLLTGTPGGMLDVADALAKQRTGRHGTCKHAKAYFEYRQDDGCPTSKTGEQDVVCTILYILLYQGNNKTSCFEGTTGTAAANGRTSDT